MQIKDFFISLSLAEGLGILGFTLAFVSLAIKLKEFMQNKAKLKILSETYPSKIIIEMRKGEYFRASIALKKFNMKVDLQKPIRDDSVRIKLMLINNGNTAIQILSMNVFILDNKKRLLFGIPLEFSTTCNVSELKEQGHFNEIIDVGANQTVRKTYNVKVSNANTTSMKAKWKQNHDWIEVHLSNGKYGLYRIGI